MSTLQHTTTSLGAAPPLDVNSLRIAYGDRVVIEDFSLHVDRSEVVALVGPSGSGKSSVLGCIVGLLKPTGGEVVVGGYDLSGASSAQRSRLRRELIGVALQDPSLLPELTIVENVAIAELFDGVPRSTALSRARESLAAVGVGVHASKRVDEISGGEAQRVSLARALVRDSTLFLVADEPTASLDARNALAIGRLIIDRVKHREIGALVATHDERIAAMCDRVIDLRPQG